MKLPHNIACAFLNGGDCNCDEAIEVPTHHFACNVRLGHVDCNCDELRASAKLNHSKPGKVVQFRFCDRSLFALTESGELWSRVQLVGGDHTTWRWAFIPGPTADDRPQLPKEKQHGTET